jgi:hypothetical protein
VHIKFHGNSLFRKLLREHKHETISCNKENNSIREVTPVLKLHITHILGVWKKVSHPIANGDEISFMFPPNLTPDKRPLDSVDRKQRGTFIHFKCSNKEISKATGWN